MKVNMQATLNISKYGTKWSEIAKFAERVPDGATLSVNFTEGDRPWEVGTTSLTWNWTEQR